MQAFSSLLNNDCYFSHLLSDIFVTVYIKSLISDISKDMSLVYLNYPKIYLFSQYVDSIIIIGNN